MSIPIWAGSGLDVEPKLHNITILHDVVLTLHADLAGSFCICH